MHERPRHCCTAPRERLVLRRTVRSGSMGETSPARTAPRTDKSELRRQPRAQKRPQGCTVPGRDPGIWKSLDALAWCLAHMLGRNRTAYPQHLATVSPTTTAQPKAAAVRAGATIRGAALARQVPCTSRHAAPRRRRRRLRSVCTYHRRPRRQTLFSTRGNVRASDLSLFPPFFFVPCVCINCG
jgi:hypothetical protein